MYLILNKVDRRIMFISQTINYDVFNNYVIDSGLHINKTIVSSEEVDRIPEEVIPKYYCYINNEFVFDENYEEKSSYYFKVTGEDLEKIECYNILMGVEE